MQWVLFLHSLNMLFSSKEYGEGATAALAATPPANKPGRQLAACLLDFTCCLAEMGLPASGAAAPEAGAAAYDCSIMDCGRELLRLNCSPALEPCFHCEAVRGDRGMCLLTAMAGLLEWLHEQQRHCQRQQHADASLAVLRRQAAQARLAGAGAACAFTSQVLASYKLVLNKLLPPRQAAGHGQRHAPLQGSLLRAAQTGLRYASHAVHSLPHAAAVFAATTVAANWDSEEESVQARDAVAAFADHASFAVEIAGQPRWEGLAKTLSCRRSQWEQGLWRARHTHALRNPTLRGSVKSWLLGRAPATVCTPASMHARCPPTPPCFC